MRRYVVFLAFLLASPATARSLDFDHPALRFTESCPLGNGRLGLMHFGDVADERLVLNESGMWSGSRADNDREGAVAALPEIRRLLLEGKNAEAESLVNRNFTCAGQGSAHGNGKSAPYGCYQVLGNLRLKFAHVGEATAYHRELDLQQAVSTVEYKVGDVAFRREALVSRPDDVAVLRLSTSADGSITCDIALDRPERATPQVVDGDLLLTGQLEDGKQATHGVRFAARVRVVAKGGAVKSQVATLHVEAADEVLVFVAGITDIRSFGGRRADDPAATCQQDLDRAAAISWDDLRARHEAAHRELYDRVELKLAAEASPLPLPDRLKSFQDGGDEDLVATLFDYGRYLLISSSRPGGLPTNLQGIWAEELQTPWNADWHANVNIQMNYWPAEICNLSELHDPAFALIESLVEPGQRTAQQYYGARGWVAHLLLNPWGFTAPGESASWGSTPTCSAWMCQHLWDHYLFTRDREFLERAYPLLKGAAEFYADLLIEEPTHGWLVTAPSNSPENAFRDAQGRGVHTCMGPTMDQQLLRYLFDATIAAAEILQVDEPLRNELTDKRARLAPTPVGSDGRVQEWLAEVPEADPQHRHISHLWGLYPGHEIHPRTSPQLAAAARKSLEVRGDAGTGWSLAYKVCMWARLGDGDRAHAIVRRLLTPVGVMGINMGGGGVYTNLFDAHPPFQIDGNLGATAGMAEMLVQSDLPSGPLGTPSITLLPALPSAWPTGSIRGLRARGGVEVQIEWNSGKLAAATLVADNDVEVEVNYAASATKVQLVAGKPVRLGAELQVE